MVGSRNWMFLDLSLIAAVACDIVIDNIFHMLDLGGSFSVSATHLGESNSKIIYENVLNKKGANRSPFAMRIPNSTYADINDVPLRSSASLVLGLYIYLFA